MLIVAGCLLSAEGTFVVRQPGSTRCNVKIDFSKSQFFGIPIIVSFSLAQALISNVKGTSIMSDLKGLSEGYRRTNRKVNQSWKSGGLNRDPTSIRSENLDTQPDQIEQSFIQSDIGL